MKAVRVLEYGGELVIQDVPKPAIARDEILVKIKSTAVNHLDLVEASGTARQILPIDLPCRDRVCAPGCGPGLEGHRREPGAHWVGSSTTQVTRQDRAASGLDISNERA